MNYIDLVLCRHNNCGRAYLFQAPAFSRLKTGDRVTCMTKHGEQDAIVQSNLTVTENSPEFNFAVVCAGATLPLAKVIGKIEFKAFKYEGEDNDE